MALVTARYPIHLDVAPPTWSGKPIGCELTVRSGRSGIVLCWPRDDPFLRGQFEVGAARSHHPLSLPLLGFCGGSLTNAPRRTRTKNSEEISHPELGLGQNCTAPCKVAYCAMCDITWVEKRAKVPMRSSGGVQFRGQVKGVGC